MLVGSDPLDPDTDGDGIIDGPDGLGDLDYDGIINVLDPTDDRSGVSTGEAPDPPSSLSVMTGGATWANSCTASVAGVRRNGAGLLFVFLLASVGLRRRRRDA